MPDAHSFSVETLEDHENCMKSADWGVLNQEWGAFLEKEEVNLRSFL